MGKIIDGELIAAEIFKEIKREVKTLKRKPVLAVMLVGDNFASASYVRGKIKAGSKVRIEVKVFDYHGTNEAMQIIEDGKRRFKEKNGK